MGFRAAVGVGVTGQGRPAGPPGPRCGLRSRCRGWITEHHCHLVAAHTWTAGKLEPKHPRLSQFPIALNLFERNAVMACLGLSFPHLWKVRAAASLEGDYTWSGFPGVALVQSQGLSAWPRGSWVAQVRDAGTPGRGSPAIGRTLVPRPALGLDGEGAP